MLLKASGWSLVGDLRRRCMKEDATFVKGCRKRAKIAKNEVSFIRASEVAAMQVAISVGCLSSSNLVFTLS